MSQNPCNCRLGSQACFRLAFLCFHTLSKSASVPDVKVTCSSHTAVRFTSVSPPILRSPIRWCDLVVELYPGTKKLRVKVAHLIKVVGAEDDVGKFRWAEHIVSFFEVGHCGVVGQVPGVEEPSL